MRKVYYKGYIIYVSSADCKTFSYDVGRKGYDYPVFCTGKMKFAKQWIDEHPDGDAVVNALIAEKEERARIALIDILCG